MTFYSLLSISYKANKAYRADKAYKANKAYRAYRAYRAYESIGLMFLFFKEFVEVRSGDGLVFEFDDCFESSADFLLSYS